MTSPFGPRRFDDGTYDFHEGLDIASDPEGSSLHVGAVHRGKVEQYDTGAGYGQMVYLYWLDSNDEPTGQLTRYCHLESWTSGQDGQIVGPGIIIGMTGDSGETPGNDYPVHLHFEYWSCHAGGPFELGGLPNGPTGYTCKQPPTQALHHDDTSEPQIAILRDMIDSVSVQVTISRDEMDFKAMEFLVSSSTAYHELICFTGHHNCGNDNRPGFENGYGSQVENDDMNGVSLLIYPTEIVNNWQVTFTLYLPGYNPASDNVCAEVTDFSGSPQMITTGGIPSSGSCPENVDPAPTPSRTLITQNKPNPFNDKATYGLAIATPAQTRLDIYDVRGRHVARIFDDKLEAGEHSITWTGTGDNGRSLPSGRYYVTARSGSFSQTIQTVIVR